MIKIIAHYLNKNECIIIQFTCHPRTSSTPQPNSYNTDSLTGGFKTPLLEKISGVTQATLSSPKAESDRNIPDGCVKLIAKFFGNEEIATIGNPLSFRKALIFSKVTGVNPPENNDHLLSLIRSPDTSKEEKSLTGKQINENRKHQLKLEKKYGNDPDIKNNIEHVIPQSVLGAKKMDSYRTWKNTLTVRLPIMG